MNAIANYRNSDSEEDSQPIKKPKLDVAPQVQVISKPTFLTSKSSKEITLNVPFEDLSKPIQGPLNPFVQLKEKNMQSGFVEEHFMDDVMFKELHRTFNKTGTTIDPDAQNTDVTLISQLKKVVKERNEKGSLEGDYYGPWAGYKEDERKQEPLAPEQIAYQPDPSLVFDKSKLTEQPKVQKEKSIFHGTEVLDYLGRSFLHVPMDVGVDLRSRGGDRENFIPKTLIHTYTGHTKSVNTIKYFPRSAHLMLSASTDGKVKIWDVYHDRACKRTYMGHTKGVKDVSFNYDGTQFVSMGYDKYLKVWDTETGEIMMRASTKFMPYCVQFNPTERKGHLFLVGCQDKKIYQFDTRSGEMVLEYAQHSGPINSLTFIDEDQRYFIIIRFLSTSDDKSLRLWEFDVPAVVKYIAEPDMHSMPAVSLSHDRKWLAGQSMDNRILIFSVLDKFKLNRKKVFSGHLTAGTSCGPGFSTDGRFVMSGDADGKLWFWDWKTCKVFKKFKAHEGAVTNVLWHPHESSKVASCSVDGTIKYWD